MLAMIFRMEFPCSELKTDQLLPDYALTAST
jgi:hypothetical protein